MREQEKRRMAIRRAVGRIGIVAVAGAAVVVGLPGVASAHDQPAGNDFVLADWMLMAWAVTFVAGLIVFVVALKRGLLSDLEGIKHYVLTIDEPDYYTPEWAREEVSDGLPDGDADLARS